MTMADRPAENGASVCWPGGVPARMPADDRGEIVERVRRAA